MDSNNTMGIEITKKKSGIQPLDSMKTSIYGYDEVTPKQSI